MVELMSDLTSLMQMSPGMGGFYMGQNQANNTAMDQLKMRELADLVQQRALESQQKQQMNPLLQEHQRLQNQGLQAGLPGITAEAQTRQQAAQKGAATLQSGIEATNATNQKTVDDAKYEKLTKTRDVMLQAGPVLSQVPPPMRGAAFRQMIEQAGMNINNPQVQAILAQAQNNPEGFPQMIAQMAEQLGKQATMMNPAAQASKYTADAHERASKYGDDKRFEAAKYTADKSEKARIRVAEIKNEAASMEQGIMNGKVPPDRAAVAAKLRADRATDPEEKAFWQQKAAEFERFSYNKAQAGREGSMQLTPKTIAPALGPGGPKAGQTSSGVKYKIIPN
jgi:hypothetical protein